MKLPSATNRVASPETQTTNPWPAALESVLSKVEHELEAGQPQQAMEMLRRADPSSPWAANALGVCQLRLGQFQAAVETFRRLAVADHLTLRVDAPTVFKVNMATALFLSGNSGGGMGTMHEISEKAHPATVRLQQAVDHWKANLPLLQKINWYFGGEPKTLLTLDSPGDLK